jgi:hypothetical protein
MRMMLIYFGAAAVAYFLSGIGGRFTKRTRLYFAIGAFAVAYLAAITLTLFEGGF